MRDLIMKSEGKGRLSTMGPVALEQIAGLNIDLFLGTPGSAGGTSFIRQWTLNSQSGYTASPNGSNFREKWDTTWLNQAGSQHAI